MSLAAGILNRLMRVEALSGAVDEANQPIEEWVVVKPKIWANIRAPSGLATITADNVTENRPRFSVRVRYRTDLDISMRLVWIKTGLVFAIEDIKPNHDLQDWTDMVCREWGDGS